MAVLKAAPEESAESWKSEDLCVGGRLGGWVGGWAISHNCLAGDYSHRYSQQRVETSVLGIKHK